MLSPVLRAVFEDIFLLLRERSGLRDEAATGKETEKKTQKKLNKKLKEENLSRL